MKTCFIACGCMLLSIFIAASAPASQIGQTIADRVDVLIYRHYLDDLLYTHNGSNKGVNGAQHDPCRDNIAATLQSFGLTVQLHPFTYLGNTY